MKRTVVGREKQNRKQEKKVAKESEYGGATDIHRRLLLAVRLTSAHFWNRSNTDAAKLLFQTPVCP